MLNSKLNIALYTFAAMLVIAPTAANAQTGRAVGPTMCACPGAHKPLGNNRTCEDACFGSGSSSSSGPTSSGGSIGTIIGNEIGNQINKALFGDPQEDARRRAREALEQQRNEELQRAAAVEADRRQEEQKNRLLGGMMGVEASQSLGLMGVESGPGLSLMTDSASAITPPAGKRSDRYTKGFEHASQCISQNSGSACVGVTADQQQACVADYRGGYDRAAYKENLFCRRPIKPDKAPPRGVNLPMAPRTRVPWGRAVPTGSWLTTTDMG